MSVCSYLYTPSYAALEEQGALWLKAQGADPVLHDWGSRIYLENLLQRITDGSVQQLLLLRLSDLGDRVDEVHKRLLQIQQAGIRLSLVTESGVQTPANAEAWLPLLADIPHQLQSRRLCRSQASNRLAGKPPPGPAPFGYRREGDRYVLDRKQSGIVEDFFQHFLLYGSLRQAVRFIEEKHHKRISVATGRNWLLNPVYRGDLAYTDGTTLRDTHVALLSRTEAAQIDRWLKRNQGIPRRSASAPRSLAGLVHCRSCGSSLRIVQTTPRQGKKNSPSYLYLRCQPCRYSLNYVEVLQEVIRQVCEQLPQRTQHLDESAFVQARQGIQSQIQANTDILSQLETLQGSGLIDEHSLAQRRYQLRAENALLAQKLEQLPPPNLPQIAQTLSIQPFWQDLTETERRAYLREFLRSIEVDSSGNVQVIFVFDP
ncbi:MAG: recombinase family protein [Cyanobacteriota bacterium]